MTVSTDREEKFCPAQDFIVNRKFLTANECDRVIELGNNLITEPASIGGNDHRSRDEHIRKSRTGWIDRVEENEWLFERLQELVLPANEKFYRFNILGFEPLQYTIYDEPGSHYDFHIDMGRAPIDSPYIRKLSISIQLSEPDTYSGGDLEMFFSMDNWRTLPRDRGSAALFSSFMLHRVSPMTAGVRHSLVGWVYGLPFR